MGSYGEYVRDFLEEYEEPVVEDYIVGFSGLDPDKRVKAATIDHEQLGNLLGGDFSGRYHLTQEQVSKLMGYQGQIDKVKSEAEAKIASLKAEALSAIGAVDERLSEARENLDGRMTELEGSQSELEVSQESISTRFEAVLEGATEDSEILDARVDADNVIHQNLGHNVRNLHSLIKELFGDIEQKAAEIQDLLSKSREQSEAHKQLQEELNAEVNARTEEDINLQREIDTLSEGQIEQILTVQELNERRKADIKREAEERQEADDELGSELTAEREARTAECEEITRKAEGNTSAIERERRRLDETIENLTEETKARIEDDKALSNTIENLAEGLITDLLNLKDALDRRKEALEREINARTTEDARLQEQIDRHTEDLNTNAQKIREESQERKQQDKEICKMLYAEAEERIKGDLGLALQAEANAEANILNSLNLEAVNERRKRDLDREEEERISNDEVLQEQVNETAEAVVRTTLNLHEEAEKRREGLHDVNEALNIETQTREETDTEIQQRLDGEEYARRSDDTAQQLQIEANAEAGIRNALNIHDEAENRRKEISDVRSFIKAESEQLNTALESEEAERISADGVLQAQADDNAKANILNILNLKEVNERRKADLACETHERIEADRLLQDEINDNSTANIQHSLSLAHEADERRKLAQAVANLKSPVDWSSAESLAIPEPRCAVVNFTGLNAMPTSKTADIPAVMEFWDRQGNFFRKNILCSAQGNSSLGYIKKNVKFDLLNEDGSEFNLRIGSWVVQDGFHLKAYYTDFFRGVGAVSYKLWDEIMKTKPHKSALVDTEGMNTTANGEGNIADLTLQIDTGALCHPDGFPCVVYLNGEFYGIFSWQIKKQRKNYHMDKSTVEHIHLDGTLYTGYFWNGVINWTVFEIRNPNKLYTMDGKKYDGDAPKELIDETSEKYNPDNKDHKRTAKVKKYIQGFVQNFSELKTLYTAYTGNPTAENLAAVKAKYEQIFDMENQRDYLIFSDIIKNSDGFGKNWQWTTYDGVKWFVNAYDLDMSFGGHWQGIQITPPLTAHITTSTAIPTGYIPRLYNFELEARYKVLREAGIIDVEHIISKLADWTARIGEGNYELEFERWPNSPCILNYNDSVDRVRKWLEVEIANMDRIYNYNPDAPNAEYRVHAQALKAETAERQTADQSESEIRASEDKALQEEISSLSTGLIQSELNGLALNKKREKQILQETLTRSEDDKCIQDQINDIVFAVTTAIIHGHNARERLKEYVDRLYQAVADTGNLTYMGAGIASQNEINAMLNDVLSGSDNGEIREDEIPETLSDRIATSSEVDAMLREIFPNYNRS